VLRCDVGVACYLSPEQVVLLRLEHLYYHYSPADDAQRAEALAWQAKKDGKPAPAVADVKDKVCDVLVMPLPLAHGYVSVDVA
jgi:hypothetical protein